MDFQFTLDSAIEIPRIQLPTKVLYYFIVDGIASPLTSQTWRCMKWKQCILSVQTVSELTNLFSSLAALMLLFESIYLSIKCGTRSLQVPRVQDDIQLSCFLPTVQHSKMQNKHFAHIFWKLERLNVYFWKIYLFALLLISIMRHIFMLS